MRFVTRIVMLAGLTAVFLLGIGSYHSREVQCQKMEGIWDIHTQQCEIDWSGKR